MSSPTFYTVLSEAIRDFAEHGFEGGSVGFGEGLLLHVLVADDVDGFAFG